MLTERLADDSVRAFAPAKINLALHVTGQRADGYHLLDTLVCFADIGDTLTLAPSDTLSLVCEGPEGAGLSSGDNLIVEAAAALQAMLQTTSGAAMVLDKRLPVSSGIGGGSSDAAAALRGLAALWHAEPDAAALEELAFTLGADVPMCLAARSLRATGIGEAIEPVTLPDFGIVLVNPRVAVSTPSVFSGLATKKNAALPPLPVGMHRSHWLEWLRGTRNDLQVPAITQVPEIAACLAMLERAGASFARMSGSGATCFGLFDDLEAASSAAVRMAEAKPGWWVRAGNTLSS